MRRVTVESSLQLLLALKQHPCVLDALGWQQCKRQNPCSEASHPGNSHLIVVMFCVSMPVLSIETFVVSAEKCFDKLLPLKQVCYREAVSRSDEKQTTFLCRLAATLS